MQVQIKAPKRPDSNPDVYCPTPESCGPWREDALKRMRDAFNFAKSELSSINTLGTWGGAYQKVKQGQISAEQIFQNAQTVYTAIVPNTSNDYRLGLNSTDYKLEAFRYDADQLLTLAYNLRCADAMLAQKDECNPGWAKTKEWLRYMNLYPPENNAAQGPAQGFPQGPAPGRVPGFRPS